MGVVIEGIGVTIAKSKQYNRIERKYLSSKNIRRFHCILASPLLAMSAISNFFFFGGEQIGNIFIQNTLNGKFLILKSILFKM